jgi:hypothetical protein
MDHGVTGFLVDDIDEAALAVTRVAALDRGVIASKTRERFSADRMVDAYEAVYRRLITPAAADRPPIEHQPIEAVSERSERKLERAASAGDLIVAGTR